MNHSKKIINDVTFTTNKKYVLSTERQVLSRKRYFDLASKCEVIKMYSGLSASLVINVVLAVKE